MINWNTYPYTDFHELNLDWILSVIKALDAEMDSFVNVNTIKYADPLTWSITSQYEQNTLVQDDNGNTFLSKIAVPKGIALGNNEYWLKVADFSGTADVIRKSIALANDGASTTTSADRNINDLVWLDGDLYVVIRAIENGDRYVIAPESNPNVEIVTIELLLAKLKDTIDGEIATQLQILTEAINTESESRENADNNIINSLNAEINARENADNNIINSLNAEINARENADNNIINSLNAEIEARENADNDIIDLINTNAGTYRPIGYYDLDNTGASDNSSKLSDISDNVGLSAGTYLISNSCTINGQMVFAKGAVLNIREGVTVTINGAILAGRYKIFNGGNVIVNNEANPVGYPEWFGAEADNMSIDNTDAINKCINKFCITELSSGDYYINGTITIIDSNRTLRGCKKLMWAYSDDMKRGTRIISKQSTETIIQMGTLQKPSSINLSTQNVLVEDICVTRTTGSDWVSNSVAFLCTQLLRSSLINCAAFNNDIGIIMQGCTNLHINKCNVFNEILPNSALDRTMRGVIIDNSILSANNIPNVSIYIDDCIINTGGGVILNDSTGVAVYSSTNNCSDIFINGNAIEWVRVGILLNGNGVTDTSNDIHITHNEMDVILANGILLSNMGAGANITIDDNYIAPSSDTSLLFQPIYVSSSSGVTITNNSVVAKNNNNSNGIAISNSNNINSTGNMLIECNTGIYIENSSCCEFSDLIEKNTITGGTAVVGSSISHCIIRPSIVGNPGHFSNGVYLTSSSACDINVTKIQTSAIASGTGHYVFVNSGYATNTGEFNGSIITGIMA